MNAGSRGDPAGSAAAIIAQRRLLVNTESNENRHRMDAASARSRGCLRCRAAPVERRRDAPRVTAHRQPRLEAQWPTKTRPCHSRSPRDRSTVTQGRWPAEGERRPMCDPAQGRARGPGHLGATDDPDQSGSSRRDSYLGPPRGSRTGPGDRRPAQPPCERWIVRHQAQHVRPRWSPFGQLAYPGSASQDSAPGGLRRRHE